MVNNSTKGKFFAIVCIVLIAFGCSSASNLVFGDIFTFNELLMPGETSKMNIIENNEFNPVHLVNHKKEYIKNKTITTTNRTNKVNRTNKTIIYKKTNKTINYNKTKYTNDSNLF